MRSLSSTLHRLRRTGDAGMTLIELLVSMIMFSIVVAAAFAALTTVQTQTRDTLARSDAVQQAKIAIAQMDRQIRSGNVLYDPVQEATLGFPMSMRVYTQANGEEKCVQWQILNNALRMRSWNPADATGSVSSWVTEARDIANQSVDVPFKLANSSAYSARVVDVYLRVKNPQSKGQPYEVKTSLAGRNTVYGYDTNVCSPIPPA